VRLYWEGQEISLRERGREYDTQLSAVREFDKTHGGWEHYISRECTARAESRECFARSVLVIVEKYL
jgi:hypothetical protein